MTFTQLVVPQRIRDLYETVLDEEGSRELALLTVASELVDMGLITCADCPVLEEDGVYVTDMMKVLGFSEPDTYGRPVLVFAHL